MSEHILRIFLKELDLIRIVCKCGATTEVRLDRIVQIHSSKIINCPGCDACLPGMFNVPNHKDHPLKKLADAIQTLKSHSGEFNIEFVLPQDETKPSKLK